MTTDDQDADPDAHEPADRRQGHGLHQELGEDVPPARPDGHPEADLAGPLGHRHQHDVHDADAADQERDGRDRRQQHRHDAGRFLLGREHLGEDADLEVVVLARLQPVALPQDGPDLLLAPRP